MNVNLKMQKLIYFFEKTQFSNMYYTPFLRNIGLKLVPFVRTEDKIQLTLDGILED